MRLTASLIALLAALLLCPAALGDADPASDVLLGENVFYPYSPAVSSHLQGALDAEVKAAHQAHLPLRVALIDTPIDLGAIPSFFGKPRQYAAFLDQEISFGSGKVPLLVVMPSGYGSAGLPAAAAATVTSLPRPGASTSDALARAALSAVRRLAAAAGHPVGAATGAAPRSSGSGAALPLAILIAVCVGLAAGILTLRRSRGRAPATRGRR